MKKILLLFLLVAAALSADDLFTVGDKPNDDGSALVIKYKAEKPYSPGTEVYLLKQSAAGWDTLTVTGEDSLSYEDSAGLVADSMYTYRLVVRDTMGTICALQEDGIPTGQWFNRRFLPLLIISIILSALILYYIFTARRGRDLYIRPIAGLDSMDEAVGRATEMGLPILFVPGTSDLDDMMTISSLTVLDKLSEKAALNETRIIVPVSRSMVMSAAREILQQAYTRAGRPDSYDENSVFYLTDDQFGYVAGVDGVIMREKPAAIFLLGCFYAESLILAETGFLSGAIQTSGTAISSQIPFFVATCDYTLIGEELYAASAYLSREPNQLGSLKGQDIGKAMFLILLLIGIVLECCDVHFLKEFISMAQRG